MHPFPCWTNVMIPTMSCWTGQTRSEIQTLLACTLSPTCSSCQSRPSTTSTERRTERPIGYADSVLILSEWIAILSKRLSAPSSLRGYDSNDSQNSAFLLCCTIQKCIPERKSKDFSLTFWMNCGKVSGLLSNKSYGLSSQSKL